jgi:two-component system, chemotaxis family, chemotaxis protein CheY
MKTLIVEDEFISRKILQRLLLKLGECDVSVNGKEAFQAFREDLIAQKPYDLICLDIMMPEMNGHEFLANIREEEKRRGILGRDGVKVIMVTGLDDPKSMLQSFQEGCEAYLTKPLEPAKLYAELKNLKLLS